MAAKRSSARAHGRSVATWAAAVLLGGLLGSGLALLAQPHVGDGPLLGWLVRTWPLGTPGGGGTATADLRVVTITLGASVHVGPLTLLGAAAAAWGMTAWRR